jgi:ferredoxin-NADP reductase
MNILDPLLNKITMYKLVAFGLGIISVLGIILAAAGRISMDPSTMVLSLALLAVSSFVTEFIFSKIWRRPLNTESWAITTFIIFLIFPAPKSGLEVVITLLVGGLASSSKYLIAWKGKHIFNPAALAVAVVGILNLQITTWWVGSAALWLVTLIFGLLVVRKIRKFTLLFAFVGTALILQLITFLVDGTLSPTIIQSVLIASPLIFLSTIMLTEPATMPPRRFQQVIFGVIIAILYVEAWKIGPLTIYPEVALLLGNIYAFVISPKFKVEMRLKEIQKISDRVMNYVFIPTERFNFIAGQYMEWTLDHVTLDFRGNRRSFTIASSPTEETVQLGVKFYNPSSTFKYTLSNMKPGDTIYASQLAGNFVLKGNERKKLVFIAGGIGVTPFRSMVKYVTDTQLAADIVVIYAVGDPSEFAYLEEFKQAEKYGVKLARVVTSPKTTEDGYLHAQVNAELISQLVPDYNDRFFYISGPNVMVDATRAQLSSIGVPRARIKKDHFSGY